MNLKSRIKILPCCTCDNDDTKICKSCLFRKEASDLYEKIYNNGYNDGIKDNKYYNIVKRISDLFEQDTTFYQGWFCDRWYEIKNILEEEYWGD